MFVKKNSGTDAVNKLKERREFNNKAVMTFNTFLPAKHEILLTGTEY
jgi:hypothetical protein